MSNELFSSSHDDELARFFTDAEYLRELLRSWIVAPILPKPILIIHGVGGVGKSSLLRMFRLQGKKEKVPISLASGDEAKSIVEVLSDWANDLSGQGVVLTTFNRTLAHYRMIQMQVQEQAKKAEGPKTAEKMVKGTAKTLVAMAGSAIPTIGPLMATLGGIGAEAVVDWLLGQGFAKPDIDLLIDPSQKMTDNFLNDIARFASKKRLVLMLDTYEQLTALEDWASEMTQRLNKNVLIVVAGRKLPNWDRHWQGWTTQAQIEELKPMDETNMRELVRRYYATMHNNEPEPKQVEAIVQFARGLPMVVTTAVRLWVKYDIEDFEAVKSEVVADLVDRLLEGVPEELGQRVKAASTLRWFNQSILRTVLGVEISDGEYKELRLFPFVRPHAEGFALHDTVREVIDNYLRVHKPEYHRELHKQAANYFELIVSHSDFLSGISEDWQRLTLEEVYHLIQADEGAGLDLLSSAFRLGITYLRYQFCYTLLHDAKLLPLSDLKSVHRLSLFNVRLKATELSWAYVNEDDLQALVLECDIDIETKWEVLLSYAWFLGFTAKHEKAREYYEMSLDALRVINQEESVAGCLVLTSLASAYGRSGFVKEFAQRAIDISQKIGEPLAGYEAYTELGHAYFSQGNYSKAEELWQMALEIARRYQNDVRISDAYNKLAQALIATGKLPEAEVALNSAMQFARRLPNTLGGMLDKEMYIKRHWGLFYHACGDLEKAIQYLSESARTYRERRSTNGLLRTLILLADCLYEANRQSELQVLAVEIDTIASRSGMGDWITRWKTLQGHILLDNVSEKFPLVDDAEAMYETALIIALDWNIQTLHSTVQRIRWKLGSLLHTEKDKVALSVIQGLTRFWEAKQIRGVFLTAIEQERRTLSEAISGSLSTPNVLTQLKSIETQSFPRVNPSLWDGL